MLILFMSIISIMKRKTLLLGMKNYKLIGDHYQTLSFIKLMSPLLIQFVIDLLLVLYSTMGLKYFWLDILE